MASTSVVDEPAEIEQHVFEEEIEEETVWMDEEEAHNFLENDKKMRMAYEENNDELTAREADEYQDVDVEEYEEAVQAESCNLPDLLSKKYQPGGFNVTVCFSKKGSHQLASDGYLYNLYQTDESCSTWECINEECRAIITSYHTSTYDMTSIDKNHDIHDEMCERDEAQLRLRIAIYDLRLTAEFTEAPLHILYDGFVSQFCTENPELVDIIPPFNLIRRSLEDHRRNKLYRRNFDSRFVAENLDKSMEEEMAHDESMVMSLNAEEIVEESYAERVPIEGELTATRPIHVNHYGRTRGFPPTFCVDCNIDMSPIRGFTLQHSLVHHVNRIHHAIKIHTFIFEPSAFEMWLREVQRCAALRFRRFFLFGDDMYYLCSCDTRLQKSKYTTNCCCTAYIKINDYRNVSARQAPLVSIEYSFEHFGHDVPHDGPKPPERMIADLRPEEFLFQMERRKQATANLVRSRQEMNQTRRYSVVNALPMRPGFSTVRVPEDVFSPYRSESRTAITRQVAFSNKIPSARFFRPSGSKPLEPPGLITRRANFHDQSVFETVRQFEQLSHIVTRRLQNVKNIAIAEHYSDIMRRMVNRIVSDMDCAPEGSAQSVWCGVDVPRNGRNPASKRAKSEDREEEGELVRKRMRKGEDEEETRETEKEGEEVAEQEGMEERREEEEAEKEGEGEEVVETEEGEEQPKEMADCSTGGEGEKTGIREGVKTRGRSQLPVRNTLVATGRDIEKEKEKTANEVKEDESVLSPRKRVTTLKMREHQERRIPQILARSKSSRIQARKEKIGGDMEEKKT